MPIVERGSGTLLKKMKFAVVSVVLALSGCAGTSQVHWNIPPMAVPFQATMQQQIQLARIEQLLGQKELTDKQVAQLYLQRGLVYDSLGIKDLARMDFAQSLSINPKQADVYNILGVYLTQVGLFDAAYEAFDSTLDLEPSHPYAQRNLGIALYYGERLELAHQELYQHYLQDKNDPYRAIWLYLVDVKTQPQQAARQLQYQYNVSNKKDWGWNIAQLLIGKISEGQFIADIAEQSQDNQQLAEHLTEGYFYLAKQYQLQGDEDAAANLFKLALAGNVYEYVEHRYALLELALMADEEQQQTQALQTTNGNGIESNNE
ncbi:lipoprotein NlpI [Photobacterium damselae]